MPKRYEGSSRLEEDDRGNLTSVYGNRRVPTGRNKKDPDRRPNRKKRQLFGDPFDPPNDRLDKLLKGSLKVSELDDEELSAGVPKCNDGKFSKHAAYYASQLPSRLQKEIQQELYKRADNMMRGALLGSIETLVEIATGPGDHEDKDRLKAATYLLERVRGKTPEVVVHAQNKPWEIIMEGVETTTRAEARQVRAERVKELDGRQPWQDLVNEPEDAEVVYEE